MKKLLVANWKMHKLRKECIDFIEQVAVNDSIDVAIVPPYLSLLDAKDKGRDKNISIGAQNMSEFNHGAYTGEISSSMLKDVGCDFVLLGHSERRKKFLESNEVIGKKVERAVVENMPFILCVGETLDERTAGNTEEVIEGMLDELSSLMPNHLDLVTIAYEPVWAIGSGKVASKEIISEVHMRIREKLIELFGEEAKNVRILYGGSVDVNNIAEIFSLHNVNGALAGGASLDIMKFNQLISEGII